MSKYLYGMAALAALAITGLPAVAADKPTEKSAKTEAAKTDEMDCCKAADKAGMVCLMCKPEAKAEVGKPAVSFMAKDYNGKLQTLADNKGKIVVLSWYNPGCPFVVRHLEAKTFENLGKEFDKEKVTVLLVDSTASATPEGEKAASEKYKLTVPVALDRTGTIGHAYNAKSTPHVFVIDQKGTLVYSGAIDNNADGNKSGAEVVNYAEAAVKALLAGEKIKDPSTKPYGCSIKWAAKQAASAPTLGETVLASLDCDGGGAGDGDKDGKKDEKSSITASANCDGGGAGDGDKKDDKTEKTGLTMKVVAMAGAIALADGDDCCKDGKCDKEGKKNEKKEGTEKKSDKTEG